MTTLTSTVVGRERKRRRVCSILAPWEEHQGHHPCADSGRRARVLRHPTVTQMSRLVEGCRASERFTDPAECRETSTTSPRAPREPHGGYHTSFWWCTCCSRGSPRGVRHAGEEGCARPSGAWDDEQGPVAGEKVDRHYRGCSKEVRKVRQEALSLQAVGVGDVARHW